MEYFLQYSSRTTKLQAHYNKQAIFPGKGKRGEIKEFSARSRKRLFEKMIELDIRGDGAFLTLTFPDWLERDKTKYKKCFDAMRKAIEKKGSAVWKLEFTRKGVPHYHVLIDCDVPRKGIKLERQVWRDRWTKIVTRTFSAGSELERRHVNFIRISFDRVRNRAAFANYFCYYFSTHKHYQNIIPDWFRGGSRLWGVWGDWKTVERYCIKISEKEYSGIRAEAISLIKKKKSSYYNNGYKVVYYGDLASAREAVEFNKILGRLVYDSQTPETQTELQVEDSEMYYDGFGNGEMLSRCATFEQCFTVEDFARNESRRPERTRDFFRSIREERISPVGLAENG